MATQSLPNKSDKKKKSSLKSVVAVPIVAPVQSELRRRFVRSGYFFGAVLVHLVLLLLLWTLIILHAPTEPKATVFAAFKPQPPPPPPTKVEQPPPPVHPDKSAAGGDETKVSLIPPTGPIVFTTTFPSSFTLPKVDAPGLKIVIGHGPKKGHGTGTIFGDPNPDPTEFTGYLYDLKQTPQRGKTGMTPGKYHDVLSQFISSNWDETILSQYYKSPNPLSTPDIFIPTLDAADGPKAFGVEKEVKPNMYVILYTVTVSPPQDGTYHFVGSGDDILAVRVNGQTELDGSASAQGGIWDGRASQQKYAMTNFNPTWGPDGDFWIGKGFTVRAGDKVDLEVLIGEQPGGHSNYFLYIQRDQDLDNYARQSNGTPILPIFQLDPDPVTLQTAPGSYPPFAASPNPWNKTKSALSFQ